MAFDLTRRGILGMFSALPFMNSKGAQSVLSKNLLNLPIGMPIDSEDDVGPVDPKDEGDGSHYYSRRLREVKSWFGLGKGKLAKFPTWKMIELRLQARTQLLTSHVYIPSIDGLRSISPVIKQKMRENYLIGRRIEEDLAEAHWRLLQDKWERDTGQSPYKLKSVGAKKGYGRG